MSSGGKTAREVEKLAPTSFTWSVDFGFLTVHEKQQQQYQLLQSGAKLPETKDEKDHPSCPVLSCAAGFSLAETLHLFPQELHSTAVFLEPEADGSCVPGGRFLVSLGSQAFLHPDVYTNETTTTIKIANTSIIPQEVQILKSQFIPSNALHPWKHTAHGLSWRQISQLPNSSASFHSWHLQEASYTMFCSICFDQFVSTVRILTIMEDKWVKCKEQSLLND
ncbi:uncharacterized protein [Vicugna pacos]|uniref:Uncharacterized protein isoform X2 n=1 Tax=Vicugna pacos TaxID=30538 RepID=A0ABM5E5Q1_VICPA